MDSGGTFKRLVRELSPGERKDLLQKLRHQFEINQDPLYVDSDFPTLDVEEEYVRLPWYCHIAYLILSFFSTKPPIKLYHERAIAKLGRTIAARSPGFYDYSGSLLLPEFYKELVELKESARFFFNALNDSVNQDRGAFYAFLGSLEMESVHNNLVQETDPAKIAENNPGMTDIELRRIMFRKLEDTIGLINENHRIAMYADIRFLYCLKELASFLFDRVILAFNYDSAVGGMACSALTVRELLSNLNNILFSLKKIPSMSLFESLFVFILQEQMKDPKFDVNAEIRKLLSQAEHSLSAIRKFNQMVPLTLIIRCVSRNLSFSPVLVSGGEDWLTVYRDYWKHLIEDRLNAYLRTTRFQKLQESLRSFFKGINLKFLENTVSETNPDGIPVKQALSLSFLKMYHFIVFTEDNTAVFNAILIEGEFYNEDSQIDFSTSYNELRRLGEVISDFDSAISPSGDFGLRYQAVRDEMSSPVFKRRKTQAIIDEVSQAAIQIIEKSRESFIIMLSILNGTMNPLPASMYGVLTNFAKLAEKNTAFKQNLAFAVQNVQTALRFLDDIKLLESE
jgi:hypothetical protein